MTRTITVEGEGATVDTTFTLSTQGSITSPSLVVPAGVNRIEAILCSFAADQVGDGSAVVLLRIGGNAVNDGEQAVVVGAVGNIGGQAGSDEQWHVTGLFKLPNADISVDPVDTIRIQAEMMGVDVGALSVVVTLIFG